MKQQSDLEEKWNWLSHGLGFIMSILGLFVLIFYDNGKTPFSKFSICIYGVSLIVLYFSSALYHYIRDLNLKNKLRIMDHVGIYILIAGTYTPVTLIALVHSKGWLLFILVWSLALLGSILKLFFTGKYEVVSVLLYLLMGWLIVIDFSQLTEIVGKNAIMYLIYGGLAYTVGIIFYAVKKLNFNHVIWHFFVLAGSVFHFIFIWKFVI
ncbi:hemolysin III family protein [uncultured Aquimarina sp.]|uniref:PAQR family membrane homeostasis protein TrhA n=1 Tax=uncultured Aquimarina sp. TaxID=575652 RepID=UPI00260E58FB|nr:hemolysin III family protein [uncultured Aquimarina sp.]